MVSIYVVIPVVLAALILGFFLASLHFNSSCKTCLTDFYDLPGCASFQVKDFLNDVSLEIGRAKVLHRGNSHLMVALMEEVGELAKAHLENEGTVRIRCEAKHVACVAARIATEGDCDFDFQDIPPATTYDPNYQDMDSSWPDFPSRARVAGQ